MSLPWRLERLARVFPYPITAESRRRKLQRFLDLPQLTLTGIWFPLITYWLTTYCRVGQRLSIAIDPRSMGLYKSLHGQLNLAATQPSHCTGRCCPNWETVTYLNLPSLSNKFYRYLKNIKSLF